MTNAQHAKNARESAAEYLADALAFEAGGQSAEALRLFDDAVNAERWAVYYEARADGFTPTSPERRKARETR